MEEGGDIQSLPNLLISPRLSSNLAIPECFRPKLPEHILCIIRFNIMEGERRSINFDDLYSVRLDGLNDDIR